MKACFERIETAGASCAIYRDAPQWEQQHTAAIGQFSCESREAGIALLNDINFRLHQEEFKAVIGPMDGDTWHRYRVVSQSDNSPPFFLEPTSSPHDFLAFEGAGFHVISDYTSAKAKLTDAIEGSSPFQAEGITVRTWDGNNTMQFLEKLFAISSARFSSNAFYKPITQEAFLTLYEPVLKVVDRRLVFFAYSNEQDIVGFLFGLPDVLQGPNPEAAIIKTYASLRKGAGRALMDAFHHTALNLGYSHVIHALMHQDNISRNRSALHNTTTFRHYALMGKRLPQ